MRILWVNIFVIAIFAQLSWAIPAFDQFYTVTQPDGSSMEVRKKGNEHSHFTENKSGQVVRRDSKGFFKPSSKDSTHHFYMATEADEANQTAAVLAKAPSQYSTPVVSRSPTGDKNVLVVLVQFNDTKFFSDDPNADISQILNKEGYNAEKSVGSAADYFRDNSQGKLNLTFDVVGPITVSGNNYADYGSQSSNGDFGAQKALGEALDFIKQQGLVDFKKYDNNGDGYLDYVHMIYAGFGSHDSDQDSAIWPHRWIFKNTKNLGSRFSPIYVSEYACNAERDWRSYYYDRTSKKYFGVGNFIHEFSHLLGLPDLYATNNTTSDVFTPYVWDVMDMGAYNTNNARGPIGTAPPYYSAFERYTLGWLTASSLTTDITDTLTGIQNNVARRLRNPKNSNEFFLLEYRDKTKWDSALPNHGMLIWHIDYKRTIWETATINNTSHQYVDIEEADGQANTNSLPADVFPGTRRVTKFSKFITWENENLGVILKDIQENRSYTYVTFNTEAGEDVDLAAEDSTEIYEPEPDSVLADTSITDTNFVDTLPSRPSIITDSTVEEVSSDTVEVPDPIYPVVLNNLKPSITLDGNMISVSSLSNDTKSLQIYSINGNLISSINTNDTVVLLKTPRQNAPFILCITQGKKILYTQRIR